MRKRALFLILEQPWLNYFQEKQKNSHVRLSRELPENKNTFGHS